jgi:hypothetical protein
LLIKPTEKIHLLKNRQSLPCDLSKNIADNLSILALPMLIHFWKIPHVF